MRGYVSVGSERIRALRTRRRLFSLIRPLLFFYIAKEAIAFSGGLKRPSFIAIFISVRKAPLNLYSRAVSLIIRRALATIRS